jgi:hypothetical protein
MFFVDPVTTSIAFVPDASTIFVLVFAALLVIVWCALALWVYSVIRSSNHNEPEDVELAFRGRSPPQPPLPPTPSTLPSSPSRPPPHIYRVAVHDRGEICLSTVHFVDEMIVSHLDLSNRRTITWHRSLGKSSEIKVGRLQS